MLTHQDFLQQIEAFLAESGMAPTTFGVKVLKDPGFVFELRKGRSPSLATVGRVQAFISGQAA